MSREQGKHDDDHSKEDNKTDASCGESCNDLMVPYDHGDRERSKDCHTCKPHRDIDEAFEGRSAQKPGHYMPMIIYLPGRHFEMAQHQEE